MTGEGPPDDLDLAVFESMFPVEEGDRLDLQRSLADDQLLRIHLDRWFSNCITRWSSFERATSQSWLRRLPVLESRSQDLREQLAVLTGQTPTTITQGRMTYDLRRLHGMIERIPKTHRYRVTPIGLRAALFFTRVHARLYRSAEAEVMSNGPPGDAGLAHQFARLEVEIDKRIQRAKLVA